MIRVRYKKLHLQLTKFYIRQNLKFYSHEYYWNTNDKIIYCQFQEEHCEHSWVKEETLYGFCLRFRTTIVGEDRPAVDRRSALTVYLGFNKTDGYHGNDSKINEISMIYYLSFFVIIINNVIRICVYYCKFQFVMVNKKQIGRIPK